jgi:hypothetical protein
LAFIRKRLSEGIAIEALSTICACLVHLSSGNLESYKRRNSRPVDAYYASTGLELRTILAFIRKRLSEGIAIEALSTIEAMKKTMNCLCDSQSPWRRSALWLLVRVTLQLVFRRLSTEGSLDDL